MIKAIAMLDKKREKYKEKTWWNLVPENTDNMDRAKNDIDPLHQY